MGEVDLEEDSVTSIRDGDISETSLEEQPSDYDATSVPAITRSETAYFDAGEHFPPLCQFAALSACLLNVTSAHEC